MKRYNKKQKEEIVRYKETHTWKETKEKYGVGRSTVMCWVDSDYRKKQLQYLKDDYKKYGQREDRAEYRRKNNKKKYSENKEIIKQSNHEYYIANKEKIKKNNKLYYQKNKNILNEYYKQHRNKLYNEDPIFKLKANIRSYIYLLLKGYIKEGKCFDLIGCAPEQLKKHLENQFQSGMTWFNYGKWHIDHIIPCSRFDLSKREEQEKCFHYTNLQPLWAKDNLAKGKKYTLGVINCAAQKKNFVCTANQMYDDSMLFRTLRDYCQKNYDEYVILSAKYGVLYPDDIIEPYEDTVMFVPNNLLHSDKKYKLLNAEEKKIWSQKVINNINWSRYTEIHFHCGKYYMQYINPLIKDKNNVLIHYLKQGVTNSIKHIKDNRIP